MSKTHPKINAQENPDVNPENPDVNPNVLENQQENALVDVEKDQEFANVNQDLNALENPPEDLSEKPDALDVDQPVALVKRNLRATLTKDVHTDALENLVTEDA